MGLMNEYINTRMSAQELEDTKEKHREEYNTYIEFLKRTKEGRYAPIETTSMPYVRINVETEVVENYEEEYYYSLK